MRTPRLPRAPLNLRTLAWLPLALLAGGAWFLAATRIMYRLGAPDAAAGVGLLTALAVVVSLARWTALDSARASRERLVCPRCRAPLTISHEHARAGAPDSALLQWSCAACGYAYAEPFPRSGAPPHSEALTCTRCRPSVDRGPGV